MKSLSPAERQTYLLSAVLWGMALLPTIPPLTWSLGSIWHVFDPAYPIPHLAGANDFLMIWSAGHLAATHTPAISYHVGALQAFERQHLPDGFTTDPWIYPPPTLLISMLAGHLNLTLATACWLIGLALMSAALLRAAKLPWPVVIACLLTPAALFASGIGQFSMLVAALFTFSLLRADDAPGRAGFCSALTIIKPQMALLGPIILLARRRWRGLIIGALTASAILIATTLILGPGIWSAYFRFGAPMSRMILDTPFPVFHLHGSHFTYYEFYGTSVFWMLRSLDASITLATIGQIAVALGAIAYGWQVWRQPALNKVQRAAITLLLGVLISPYGFAEDLAGYSIAIILLIWQRRRLEIADTILLVWPSFLPFVAIALDVELTPVFVLWAIFRACRDLAPRTAHATEPTILASTGPVA